MFMSSEKERSRNEGNGVYRFMHDVDWKSWNPEVRVTLMFVVRGDQVLLIHKKRGLGKGKINGPGGKIELGETPLASAIRETQEELCITPRNIGLAGEIFFQFAGGHSIHGHVFRADDYEGEPTETDEAAPFWCAGNKLPFERMWEDDATWFGHMLDGTHFVGWYIFDGDRMLDAVVELDPKHPTPGILWLP